MVKRGDQRDFVIVQDKRKDGEIWVSLKQQEVLPVFPLRPHRTPHPTALYANAITSARTSCLGTRPITLYGVSCSRQ